MFETAGAAGVVGCEATGCEAAVWTAEVTVDVAAWTVEVAVETGAPVREVPSARAWAARDPSNVRTAAKMAAICRYRTAAACRRSLLTGPPLLTRKPRTT